MAEENKIKEIKKDKEKYDGMGRSGQDERVLRSAKISILEWILENKTFKLIYLF